jgi:hypothetical protein
MEKQIQESLTKKPRPVMSFHHFRDVAPWPVTLTAVVTAATLCVVRDPNMYTCRIGLALCSAKDQFSRPKGRKDAEKRARHQQHQLSAIIECDVVRTAIREARQTRSLKPILELTWLPV